MKEQQIEPDIVSRIKKLMTLADRATNEHEAALAAERMQSLLQEHNLTRAEVEASDTDKRAPDVKRERLQHDAKANLPKHRRDLMESIANNNFCMYFTWDCHVDGNKRKTHVLIGRSDNVQISLRMYDYLIDSMNSLNQAPRDDKPARYLWNQGFVDSLCERLSAQRQKREKEEANKPQQYGLVRLIDVYGSEEDFNEDFRRGLTPGTTIKRRLEEQAKKEAIKRKEQELIESGTDSDDAWYLARGYKVPGPKPVQVQKTYSRRSYSTRSDDRAWEAQWRKEQRETARRNNSNYLAGKERGRHVSLGGALKSSSKKMIDA